MKRKRAFSKVALPRSPAVFQEEFAAAVPHALLRGCGGGFCNAPPGAQAGCRFGVADGGEEEGGVSSPRVPPFSLQNVYLSSFEGDFLKAS